MSGSVNGNGGEGWFDVAMWDQQQVQPLAPDTLQEPNEVEASLNVLEPLGPNLPCTLEEYLKNHQTTCVPNLSLLAHEIASHFGLGSGLEGGRGLDFSDLWTKFYEDTAAKKWPKWFRGAAQKVATIVSSENPNCKQALMNLAQGASQLIYTRIRFADNTGHGLLLQVTVLNNDCPTRPLVRFQTYNTGLGLGHANPSFAEDGSMGYCRMLSYTGEFSLADWPEFVSYLRFFAEHLANSQLAVNQINALIAQRFGLSQDPLDAVLDLGQAQHAGFCSAICFHAFFRSEAVDHARAAGKDLNEAVVSYKTVLYHYKRHLLLSFLKNQPSLESALSCDSNWWIVKHGAENLGRTGYDLTTHKLFDAELGQDLFCDRSWLQELKSKCVREPASASQQLSVLSWPTRSFALSKIKGDPSDSSRKSCFLSKAHRIAPMGSSLIDLEACSKQGPRVLFGAILKIAGPNVSAPRVIIRQYAGFILAQSSEQMQAAMQQLLQEGLVHEVCRSLAPLIEKLQPNVVVDATSIEAFYALAYIWDEAAKYVESMYLELKLGLPEVFADILSDGPILAANSCQQRIYQALSERAEGGLDVAPINLSTQIGESLVEAYKKHLLIDPSAHKPHFLDYKSSALQQFRGLSVVVSGLFLGGTKSIDAMPGAVSRDGVVRSIYGPSLRAHMRPNVLHAEKQKTHRYAYLGSNMEAADGPDYLTEVQSVAKIAYAALYYVGYAHDSIAYLLKHMALACDTESASLGVHLLRIVEGVILSGPKQQIAKSLHKEKCSQHLQSYLLYFSERAEKARRWDLWALSGYMGQLLKDCQLLDSNSPCGLDVVEQALQIGEKSDSRRIFASSLYLRYFLWQDRSSEGFVNKIVSCMPLLMEAASAVFISKSDVPLKGFSNILHASESIKEAVVAHFDRVASAFVAPGLSCPVKWEAGQLISDSRVLIIDWEDFDVRFDLTGQLGSGPNALPSWGELQKSLFPEAASKGWSFAITKAEMGQTLTFAMTKQQTTHQFELTSSGNVGMQLVSVRDGQLITGYHNSLSDQSVLCFESKPNGSGRVSESHFFDTNTCAFVRAELTKYREEPRFFVDHPWHETFGYKLELPLNQMPAVGPPLTSTQFTLIKNAIVLNPKQKPEISFQPSREEGSFALVLQGSKPRVLVQAPSESVASRYLWPVFVSRDVPADAVVLIPCRHVFTLQFSKNESQPMQVRRVGLKNSFNVCEIPLSSCGTLQPVTAKAILATCILYLQTVEMSLWRQALQYSERLAVGVSTQEVAELLLSLFKAELPASPDRLAVMLKLYVRCLPSLPSSAQAQGSELVSEVASAYRRYLAGQNNAVLFRLSTQDRLALVRYVPGLQSWLDWRENVASTVNVISSVLFQKPWAVPAAVQLSGAERCLSPDTAWSVDLALQNDIQDMFAIYAKIFAGSDPKLKQAAAWALDVSANYLPLESSGESHLLEWLRRKAEALSGCVMPTTLVLRDWVKVVGAVKGAERVLPPVSKTPHVFKESLRSIKPHNRYPAARWEAGSCRRIQDSFLRMVPWHRLRRYWEEPSLELSFFYSLPAWLKAIEEQQPGLTDLLARRAVFPGSMEHQLRDYLVHCLQNNIPGPDLGHQMRVSPVLATWLESVAQSYALSCANLSPAQNTAIAYRPFSIEPEICEQKLIPFLFVQNAPSWNPDKIISQVAAFVGAQKPATPLDRWDMPAFYQLEQAFCQGTYTAYRMLLPQLSPEQILSIDTLMAGHICAGYALQPCFETLDADWQRIVAYFQYKAKFALRAEQLLMLQEALTEGGKRCFQLPCGAGKTDVVIRILLKILARREQMVAILIPHDLLPSFASYATRQKDLLHQNCLVLDKNEFSYTPEELYSLRVRLAELSDQGGFILSSPEYWQSLELFRRASLLNFYPNFDLEAIYEFLSGATKIIDEVQQVAVSNRVTLLALHEGHCIPRPVVDVVASVYRELLADPFCKERLMLNIQADFDLWSEERKSQIGRQALAQLGLEQYLDYLDGKCQLDAAVDAETQLKLHVLIELLRVVMPSVLKQQLAKDYICVSDGDLWVRPCVAGIAQLNSEPAHVLERVALFMQSCCYSNISFEQLAAFYDHCEDLNKIQAGEGTKLLAELFGLSLQEASRLDRKSMLAKVSYFHDELKRLHFAALASFLVIREPREIFQLTPTDFLSSSTKPAICFTATAQVAACFPKSVRDVYRVCEMRPNFVGIMNIAGPAIQSEKALVDALLANSAQQQIGSSIVAIIDPSGKLRSLSEEQIAKELAAVTQKSVTCYANAWVRVDASSKIEPSDLSNESCMIYGGPRFTGVHAELPAEGVALVIVSPTTTLSDFMQAAGRMRKNQKIWAVRVCYQDHPFNSLSSEELIEHMSKVQAEQQAGLNLKSVLHEMAYDKKHSAISRAALIPGIDNSKRFLESGVLSQVSSYAERWKPAEMRRVSDILLEACGQNSHRVTQVVKDRALPVQAHAVNTQVCCQVRRQQAQVLVHDTRPRAKQWTVQFAAQEAGGAKISSALKGLRLCLKHSGLRSFEEMLSLHQIQAGKDRSLAQRLIEVVREVFKRNAICLEISHCAYPPARIQGATICLDAHRLHVDKIIIRKVGTIWNALFCGVLSDEDLHTGELGGFTEVCVYTGQIQNSREPVEDIPASILLTLRTMAVWANGSIRLVHDKVAIMENMQNIFEESAMEAVEYLLSPHEDARGNKQEFIQALPRHGVKRKLIQ